MGTTSKVTEKMTLANIKQNISLKKRAIRFFWQRCTRGWDDSDTWSLDMTIAKLMLPRLKRFRQLTCATPTCYATHEEWLAVIDELIWMFEFKASENLFHETKENQERYENALTLFAENYDRLWW